MPGLFGGIGCDPDILRRLESGFRAIWEDLTVERTASGVLGGHAFRSPGPCFRTADRSIVGLDGEVTLYTAFEDGRRNGSLPCRLDADALVPEAGAVGNVAVLTEDRLDLAADWTGTMPLYYIERGGGLVFSSHLRPLARAVGADPDPVGILEFLRDGYTLGARTQFDGIRRLLGGQSLRYDARTGLHIREHSEAWAGVDPRFRDRHAAADAAGTALVEILEGLPDGDGPAALMMSAGWDSRTLLAGALSRDAPDAVTCYGHGDTESRELRLAGRICSSSGVPWQAWPLDDDLYDTTELRQAFARTENVVFPHWHRAGRVLSDQGARYVYAGVFGEMLGGRYWLAHASTGVRKAMTLFPQLLRRTPRPERSVAEGRPHVEELFRVGSPHRLWYLADDAGIAEPATFEVLNGDLAESLDRYVARGVETPNQLAEAFQGEHIGSRYCNVQLLSCRARGDIALPLANRDLLAIVTRTPIHARMQNQLNRLIIRDLAPRLLRLPMAATLVPAARPVVLQEASRVVRKGFQDSHWALHFATRGRVPMPRLSWPNYEFLRHGDALHGIVDELESDLWDRNALRLRVEAVKTGEFRHQLLPLSTEMAKILTMDLLLQ